MAVMRNPVARCIPHFCSSAKTFVGSEPGAHICEPIFTSATQGRRMPAQMSRIAKNRAPPPRPALPQGAQSDRGDGSGLPRVPQPRHEATSASGMRSARTSDSHAGVAAAPPSLPMRAIRLRRALHGVRAAADSCTESPSKGVAAEPSFSNGSAKPVTRLPSILAAPRTCGKMSSACGKPRRCALAMAIRARASRSPRGPFWAGLNTTGAPSSRKNPP
mmetsp:Transcript_16054/g.60720  ORF Transcript_16054/g.60720 Transcript_16054/m.60720 type:complete len:218 (-) Transcript_16054:226-879(-)